MKKHRMTVFTRLVIFLIIFVPLVFIGVNVIQKKDPMSEFKNLFGKESSEQTNYTKTSEQLTIEMQRTEIENLKRELLICKESNK